jgi:hypothetical protein
VAAVDDPINRLVLLALLAFGVAVVTWWIVAAVEDRVEDAAVAAADAVARFRAWLGTWLLFLAAELGQLHGRAGEPR